MFLLFEILPLTLCDVTNIKTCFCVYLVVVFSMHIVFFLCIPYTYFVFNVFFDLSVIFYVSIMVMMFVFKYESFINKAV